MSMNFTHMKSVKRQINWTGFITPYWPQLSDTDRDIYVNVFDFNVDISTALNSDVGELKALIMSRGDHWADYSDIEGKGERVSGYNEPFCDY